MSVKTINLNNLKSLGPYSHAAKANGFYFFSGQIGFDLATNLLVSENVSIQTQKIFENIRLLLEACDLSINNIVKMTVFVTNINDFSIINSLYSEFMNGHAPARSFVQVARLPLDAKVEIEVIACEVNNA